jgi:hypothetical protein
VSNILPLLGKTLEFLTSFRSDAEFEAASAFRCHLIRIYKLYMKMKTANFIKDGIDFYSIESENIKICVCPEKGGELSSVEYKNLFPDKELLFRGNDYSDTACPFKGRAPLMWPAVTRNYRLETLHNGQVPDKCSYSTHTILT